MAGKQDEPPAILKCTNKECGAEIPVIECYIIVQPETPQIAVKCPECNKVITLTKAKSIAYAKAYPQIQEDLDDATGYKLGEMDEMDDFGERVMHILEGFGYKGAKHSKMKTVVRSMIDTVPGFQNQQALCQLLISRHVSPMDAQQISQLACADPNQPMPLGGLLTPVQLPYMDPQQQFNQQQYPQQQPQYPQQQQYPPQQQQYPPQQQQQFPPQQPYPQQPAPQPRDDGITITEKLDQDGVVIERTIVQPKNTQAAGQVQPAGVADQLESVMQILESHGLLRKETAEPQGLTLDDVSELITNLPSNSDDGAIAALTENFNALKDQLTQNREDAVMNRLESLEAGGGYRGGEHSDDWHKDQLSHDMRKEELSLIEKGFEKILGPLAQMQTNASVLQTVQQLERMETAHGVTNGTYTQLIAPRQVTPDQVESDLGRWRERAGAGAT